MSVHETDPDLLRFFPVFTNVAETSDGGVYWEGMDELPPPGVTITSWKNKPWTPGYFFFLLCIYANQVISSNIRKLFRQSIVEHLDVSNKVIPKLFLHF